MASLPRPFLYSYVRGCVFQARGEPWGVLFMVLMFLTHIPRFMKNSRNTMWADASWISICDITDVSVESVQ